MDYETVKIWRKMDYETACKRYLREHEDLAFLRKRLKTATIQEFERVNKNIDSKKESIRLLERWFKFSGNKPPETA